MYSSLQEAFGSPVIPNTNTNTTNSKRSSKSGRSKDRDRRNRSMAMESFTAAPDPDRPANVAPPPADFVGGGASSYSNLLAAVDADQSFFPHPSEDTNTSGGYMLEPDWTAQFNGPSVPPWIKERIAAKEAEIPLRLDAATEPALWQKVPASYTSPPPQSLPFGDLDDRFSEFENRIDSKLERMFAKLSELDKGRNETSHIEIILFIIGGLFILLMLDVLVKQGTRVSLMLAAAGGGADLYKRYVSRS
jgi:hypothetical protein